MQEDEFEIGGVFVPPGESRNIRLSISETFISTPVQIPVTVIHGSTYGKKLFLTGAIHGDEVIGTAIIKEITKRIRADKLSGLLVCVPVVNLPGFMNNSRETPDRRDLNRCFPGSKSGSMASRMAHKIYSEIISKCDYGIDIHAAAIGRTNYPQIKGDLKNKGVKKISLAFGTRVVIHDKGPIGSLRRVATKYGIAVITYESGECHKFERRHVITGINGVRNVMKKLGMIKGDVKVEKSQVIAEKSRWIRAERGGILESTATLGSYVEEGDVIATVTNPFGVEVSTIKSPCEGYVVGVTTRPVVHPGDPLCHVAVLRK